MKLETEIKNIKKRLIAKVKAKGIYENFGQNEVRKLKDKHINISDYTDEMNLKRGLIDELDEWSMSYNE